MFISRYKVIGTFGAAYKIKRVINQIKATDHEVFSCSVVVLTFESVDEILKCDDSNERY